MALLVVFGAACASVTDPRNGDPGHVYYFRLAAPSLDRYTNAPGGAQQKWFRTHFYRMGVFSPYFDTKTSWYPDAALVYDNLYGVDFGSPMVHEHPDWILHDPAGRMLYIPFACKGGTCARYAGDVTNPGFRAAWIEQMKQVFARGRYRGLWIDDVNMEFRVGDGEGREVAPVDRTTGRPMTWDAWRNYIASFTEEIRRAFPKMEVDENPIWFAGPPGRDRDPAIQRQIRTADNINIERGIFTDQGLKGGTGEWSIHALFDYIDRVHALGPGVTLEEYDLDNRGREYALAGYFLISTGRDRIGDGNTNPDDWWSGYETELGAPLGPRVYKDGVYYRPFARGMVYLGEPGLSPRSITLPGLFQRLDGSSVTSVQVAGKQGLVLLDVSSRTSKIR